MRRAFDKPCHSGTVMQLEESRGNSRRFRTSRPGKTPHPNVQSYPTESLVQVAVRMATLRQIATLAEE